MHELFELLIRHARGIWRYRWYMMLVTWLVCLVGWAVVYRLPNQYLAKAQVHVDTDSVLRPLLHGLAVDLNPGRRIALMTQTLLSRPNVEKLARMTDLDLTAKTPEQMDALITRLQNTIDLSATRRGDIYTIAYENPSRRMAKRVVQSLLTIFVENSLGDTRADTNSAQQFLGQQLKIYAKKLDQAEERLAEFKRKHIGLMPAQGSSYYGAMQTAIAKEQHAELQLKEVKSQRDALKMQLKNSANDFKNYGASIPQPISPLDQRIQSTQEKIDNLLLTYTNRYPDVIALKQLKAELEAQKRKQAEKNKKAEKQEQGAAQDNDPMYQQMKMAVTQADAQVASAQARVDEYRDRVKRLKKMINIIPQVEADLQRLNRNYSVNKHNYDLLLARRESASISQQATMNAQNIHFQVINPPHVPLNPTSPNRPLYISIVLIGGILAGGVFGFVLYQLRPTFDDVAALKSITGVPVLGSISMVRTRDYLRRRRLSMASFGVAFVALIAVYGGILLVQLMDLDVISNISHLKGSLL